MQRWEFAKELASQLTCQPQSFFRQLNYYMIVLAVFISPQTSEYLPQDGKMEVFKWTAFLAGLGIAGVIRRKNKKELRLEKRKEKFHKRFWRWLFSKKQSKQSCGDCLSCWGSACNGCDNCDNCGDCSNCNNCDVNEPCFWISMVILAILIVGAIVVSVILILI